MARVPWSTHGLDRVYKASGWGAFGLKSAKTSSFATFDPMPLRHLEATWGVFEGWKRLKGGGNYQR